MKTEDYLKNAEMELKQAFVNCQNQEVERRIKHLVDKTKNLEYGVREGVFK